jgi:hypothetical protein
MPLLNATGKITLLRVHEMGTGYGPAADSIDVEVVFQMNTIPNVSIGFTLRNDASGPVHEGMLDLLRDAFTFGWTVHVDYEIGAGKRNGTLLRIWLTRDRPPVQVVGNPTRVTRA